MGFVVNVLRLLGGLVCVSLLVTAMTPILILLLPSRVLRIRVTNQFGSWIGRSVMWCSGCRLTVEGAEHLSPDRPAIYACNHTSILDAFTTIWLTPAGTVGVAKKEVFFYPFYGQAWWLAGHVFKTVNGGQSWTNITGNLPDNPVNRVLLLPDGASVKGTVAGVDSTGALVLADGPRRARFLSGEISLRRA